jgi:hypothetical protein
LVIVIIAAVGVLAVSEWGRLGRPEAIRWDLSQGETIAAVNWPSTWGGQFFDQKGNYDLTILSPGFMPEVNWYQMRQNPPPQPNGKGDVIFQERVQHFICERRGNALKSAAVYFGNGCGTDEAYDKAKKVMTDWRFSPVNLRALEIWHTAVAAHMPQGDFIVKYRTDPGVDCFTYPDFEAIRGGNVSMRISVISGAPQDGNCHCTLTLIF